MASNYDLPQPVKLDKPTASIVRKLKRKTSLTTSEILRRAVRYSAPKFLSGEVNISDVSEIIITK